MGDSVAFKSSVGLGDGAPVEFAGGIVGDPVGAPVGAGDPVELKSVKFDVVAAVGASVCAQVPVASKTPHRTKLFHDSCVMVDFNKLQRLLFAVSDATTKSCKISNSRTSNRRNQSINPRIRSILMTKERNRPLSLSL